MKSIFVFVFVFVCGLVHAQAQIFDLKKLNNDDFKSFLESKKIIFVGEMHGTTEVPQFVGELISSWRSTGKRITFGIEMPKEYQGDVDEYQRTGDFEKLMKIPHFKVPDGRGSVAMGELIKKIRKMEDVKIVCFDEANVSGNKRDSLMAVNLLSHVTNGSMVVLTGNIHAHPKEGFWKPWFKSAAFQLKRMTNAGEKMVSINAYFGGGTIWNCMNDGCKEREAFAARDFGKASEAKEFVNFSLQADPSGYDGYVYFAQVSASKPSIPDDK